MLSLFKKKAQAKGLTSVAFTSEGVAFAHFSAKAGNELTFCEFVDSISPLEESKRFKEFVDSHKLDGSRATLVLPRDAYQVLLVDRPDVPDEELADALRWKVRDLINFDVDEALIDFIELPEDAYRGRSRMVYAVAAQQDKVNPLIEWCRDIGLQPVIVDVPELALLNLTEDLADSEAGLAVFYVGNQSSAINLLSDMSLYFTRSLPYHEGAAPDSASAAVLELQRSMDYYESQIGKPPCVRLMVMPMMTDDDPLLSELRYNLALDIHSLNLENLVSTPLELSVELQRKTTVAIAAALRDDYVTIGGGA